jgi:hypothetical protein
MDLVATRSGALILAGHILSAVFLLNPYTCQCLAIAGVGKSLKPEDGAALSVALNQPKGLALSETESAVFLSDRGAAPIRRLTKGLVRTNGPQHWCVLLSWCVLPLFHTCAWYAVFEVVRSSSSACIIS